MNSKLKLKVLFVVKNSGILKFLFISTSDLYGGGSLAGYRLHKTLCLNGYLSKMVVLNKRSSDNTVIELKPKLVSFFEKSIRNEIKYMFNYRIGIFLRKIYNLFYHFLKITGREIFYYPATYEILNKIDYKPDFICLFNINEGFFDLNILKEWKKSYHLIYSLQDLWIFTGHCGVPINCDKFLTECTLCPDLNLPPKINFDRTTANFNYKKKITNLVPINYLAPSNWVLNVTQKCIIHPNSTIFLLNNAVDTKVYDQNYSDEYPSNIFTIVTCAVGFKFNPYKDLETLISSFENISKTHKAKLIVIGEKNINYPELEHLNIEFHDHIYDVNKIIDIFKKCDVLVHSSNIETWGFTVTEALSAGLPVIASNVGGLKDQVRGYNVLDIDNCVDNQYNLEEANGFLFEKNNIKQLSNTLKFMIKNREEKIIMGENAKRYALNNYGLKKHMDNFIVICNGIISKQKTLRN